MTLTQTKSRIIRSGMILLTLGALQSAAVAQTTMTHTPGMNHKMHNAQAPATTPGMAAATGQPTEGGQSAFATIAEIIVLLKKDPKTDWSKVNINGLREHLVDMSEVTLKANAKMSVKGNAVTFNVTGTGRTLLAIQNMAIPHSMVLSGTTNWKVSAQKTANGAIMTVVVPNEKELAMVKGLGFFGVMATGAHHQAHHYLMAKGATNVHAH